MFKNLNLLIWNKVMKSYKELDIRATRRANNYSKKEYFLRVLWSFMKPIFKYSPRTFFSFRSNILKLFGAKIGKSVHIYPSAIIYFPWNLEIGDYSSIGEWALIYNLGPVKIGAKVTISHRAHLCAGTHDYNIVNLPLMKKGIYIGSQAWICADAFIGPGVKVAEGAIVGAGSICNRHVEEWNIVAGNPCKFIKKRILK